MTKKTIDKKKLVLIIVAVVLVLGAGGAAIWFLSQAGSYERKGDATAKCGNVFQCLVQLDPNSSLEEMNEIVGWDAELAVDEDDTKIYTWDLSEDTAIEARFSTFMDEGESEPRKFTSINIEYPENSVEHNADLSRWSEIKEKMNNPDEGVTYEEFVEMLGSEGNIKEKTADSKKYQWHSEDGRYLNASFDNETGKCTFATGRF